MKVTLVESSIYQHFEQLLNDEIAHIEFSQELIVDIKFTVVLTEDGDVYRSALILHREDD